ncbi:MAG: hypothetical protein R3B13_21170 [Polyangiaceae bacterium]
MGRAGPKLAMALLLAVAGHACVRPPAQRVSARGPESAKANQHLPREVALAEVPPPAESHGCSAVRVALPELIETKIDVPVPDVVDPDHTLLPFYQRVTELLRGQAKDHVRIAVFGDSNMTMDWITGEMRRTLQEKYGDAGHGYVALGRPWEWYRHMDVRSGHERLDWTPFAVSTHPSPEAAYGFAGIAARSERAGAVTWVATAPESSPVGTRASRVDVYYLRKPHGGSFEIRVDGSERARISTASAAREAAFHTLELSDAPHRVELVSTTVESVTAFGVTLERGTPSFVIDSLGLGAVSGPLLLRQDREVMRAALSHRGYDLIALLLGSNQVWPVRYEAQMAELIARFREALPDVPVLVMSPVDQVKSLKSWRSTPDIQLVSRQNEHIARDNKCAFWDFRGAMGGNASMVRFMTQGMGQADGIHLTQKGARYMGRRLTYALMRDVDGWLAAHGDAGCAPTKAVPTGIALR